MAVLFAITLLVAASCGDDGEPAAGGDGTTNGDGTTEQSACVEEAQAAVDAAREPIELKLPPTPLDVDQLQGKKIFLLTSQIVELSELMGNGFEEAAAALGMEAEVFNGEGQVATWNQGVRQAVNEEYDGIVLLSVQPDLVSEPLEQGIEDGMAVVEIFNGSPVPQDELDPRVDAQVTPDFFASGSLISDWIMADSGCDATVAVFGAEVIGVQSNMMQSFEEYLPQECADCTLYVERIDLANIAGEMETRTPNILRRDPDIDYLVPVFDAAATFLIPAAQQAGFEGKVLSHDGVPAHLDLVRSGEQALDVAFPPNEWMGWALVDQLARVILEMEPAEWTVPVQLFDQTNIGEEGDEFPNFVGYEEQFKGAWGV
ncbi:MAG: sugar ABC transporter substrate-binding protein [Actinomycetota bacterium]